MNEFAVIQTGGKQYKVSVGDVISIEKLDAVKVGDKVTFDKVLLTDNGKETIVGAPFIADAKVTGTLASEGRAKKIDVIHYKQKSRYFKKNGHRQPFVTVKIETLK
ncbi:MAG: 50S ribosomal protein L21 [bacterium]